MLQLLAGLTVWFSLASALGANIDSDLTPTKAKQIREFILKLDRGEGDLTGASDALKKAPRDLLLSVLREDLASLNEPSGPLVRAILLLDARELWPELLLLAQKSERWQTFTMLNQLAMNESGTGKKSELAKLYHQRLGTLTGASKEAVLDGFGVLSEPLTAEEYRSASADDNLQVRIATVRQFLRTREALTESEQISRFRSAFLLKPYQARLIAFKGFLRLEKKQRAQLKNAVTKNLCDGERNVEVKRVCQEVQVLLGVSP